LHTRQRQRISAVTGQGEGFSGAVSELPPPTIWHSGVSEKHVDMPTDKSDPMMGFLRQNGGRFPNRVREREFVAMTDEQARAIAAVYADLLYSSG
jgi:hypothetical protein